MSEGFTEPVVYVDETHAGVLYGVTENVPEQVRTLIEGLQAPTRLRRGVDWAGGQPAGVPDIVDVEVLWDEQNQEVTYSVPGVQDRSVALSDLAEELGRDWEHYLSNSALAGELLGRLDAVLPEGIDAEEVTTRFDPQAGAVTADVELVPVPTFDGSFTRGMRGQIGVSRYGFDLDLEGDVPARQLSEADARLVLSDAVARANQEPVSVAFEEIWPYAVPFTEHGLEVADPVVRPDGTVRVQVLTPAADAGGWLGGARAEQAVTFFLDRDASGRDNGLAIRPGGSLTRELRDGTLAADDERIVEWLSPDLAVDPGVREMTDAQAAATILGMRPETFDAAAQSIEAGLRSAERELAHPTRSTAAFHMLNEQAARLKRQVLHGVPESELSTSLDMERGRVWVRPKVMDSSHRPITVGANPEGQTFEVVDRKEVPNGEVGPWTDPQPLSDEQRAAGSRLVSEREATWDVDNAVLRDGEQSVATTWASMRVASSAGWWELQEASALERWAQAQATLAGGDARVSVFETSPGNPLEAGAAGRLLEMRGNGMDCRVITTSPGQVTVATPAGKSTMTTAEMMDQVRATWPDTTTDALSTATPMPATEREQDASQVQAEAPELTVYTTPNCPGCKMTRRQLDKAGVAYEAIDLSSRPDLVEQFRAEGLRQAPIIEVDGQRTAGFNPDRIKAIVAAATPQQAPGTSGPSDGGGGGGRPTRVPQQQRPRARGEGMHL